MNEEGKALDGISHLAQLMSHEMMDVNDMILSRISSEISLIPDIAHHLINSGGKRLRPLLALTMAKLCGYQGEAIIKLAAAVEFMHAATLLHDDVVDGSDRRRGKLAARMMWGNEASVLVGDFLLGQAFRMMVEVGSLPCLELLSKAATIIAEGEIFQLSVAHDLNLTEENYLKIISSKTAVLFSAAAEIGPILSNSSSDRRVICSSYGYYLGIIFQLIDDILDYTGTPRDLGKNTGDDFREGKVTLPLLLCMQKGTVEEQKFWKNVLENPSERGQKQFDRALHLLHYYKTLEDVRERAEHYGRKAKQVLTHFPPTSERDALSILIDTCLGRCY